MKDEKELKVGLLNGDFDGDLGRVYVSEKEVTDNRQRISRLIDVFASLYGEDREVEVFSAPGRTEVGGNHTDHNHGRVLAASINLDAIAVVSPNNDNTIRIKSEKYKNADVVELDKLEVDENEKGKSTGLIRGVCAAFVERGYKIGGFDAATFSDVLTGSGLSSSAAFEVLVGTILNHLFNEGKIDPVEIAQISQYSENVYFGKPCGLMDQMACSVGGFVSIDFEDPEKPIIQKVDFDFEHSKHALCIVDTKGNHAGLDDEYGAVRLEMEAVAKYFGKNNLRELPQELFEKDIAALRPQVGDRALMRAF
ncbi:MAG TPA: galactokinase family protein, partial [Oscillospiraceae bacterium]|nr:galactokinase family protein [Oscillospiraceae bacterium]